MLTTSPPTTHLLELVIREHGPRLCLILSPFVPRHGRKDGCERAKGHLAWGAVESTLDQQPRRKSPRRKGIQELALGMLAGNVNNTLNLYLMMRVPHCMAQAHSNGIESRFDHTCVVPTPRVACNITFLGRFREGCQIAIGPDSKLLPRRAPPPAPACGPPPAPSCVRGDACDRHRQEPARAGACRRPRPRKDPACV